MQNLGVILPAAGMGTRLAAGKPKAFIELKGEPLFMHATKTFLSLPFVSEVVLAFPSEELETANNFIDQLRNTSDKRIVAVVGGKERQDSVRNALVEISAPFVAVHDAARPYVTKEIVELVYTKALETGAAIAATRATDTIKSGDDVVESTLNRNLIWHAQTPQIFKTSQLVSANQKALESQWKVTDDASLMEMYGIQVSLVQSNPSNKKITFKSDMSEKFGEISPILPRVGFGYDVHQLVEGRKLIIGGVEIPHPLGLLGHSDADVLLHAITDAILGGAALGDIGKHFPDTDPAHKNADSRILLQKTVLILQSHGYKVGNIDATIVAEKPKMLPFIELMRVNVASDLQIGVDAVSLKATTSEKMGFVGRKEGIAAHAVALVYKGLF